MPDASNHVEQSLADTLADVRVISLPYTTKGQGLFIINLEHTTAGKLPFIVDTGATRSALFRSTVGQLRLSPDESRQFIIHGIIEQGSRPFVRVPELKLGYKSLLNIDMVMLDDPEVDAANATRVAGIIGMDILKNYRIFVDANTSTFSLIPNTLEAPSFPGHWEQVIMEDNPFGVDNRDLHFLVIRIGNQQLPALMDFGSEFNVMDLDTDRFHEVRALRRQLYERWVGQGAIGTFKPEFRIRAERFRSGRKFWAEANFVVLDIQGLNIIGAQGQDFLIAGANLFNGETFYIDFANNEMIFKPNPETRSLRYANPDGNVRKNSFPTRLKGRGL